METNQSLLSWEVSQPPPYAQKSQHAPVVLHQEQQEATLWKRVWKSDILTLKKEAIVLICDRTGTGEILG